MCAAIRVRRILVVDDESLIAEAIAEILLENGYATRVALSGEQAVDLARVFEPDLLISDVIMGGMTGIETANEILSFLPSCKVILFSGQATTAESFRLGQRARENFEIVVKPLSQDVLLDRIANLA